MKKVVSLLVCILMLFVFSGCGEKKKYDEAVSYYDSKNYEQAKEIFEEISGYEDSKEYIEKCEYELSTDRSFIRDMEEAIEKRWYLRNHIDSYADDGSVVSVMVDGQEYVPSDYVTNDVSVMSEYEILEKYKNMSFESSELKDMVLEYIDVLELCLERYREDPDNAITTESYVKRFDIIETLVNSYGLEIPEGYEDTYENCLDIRDDYNEELKKIDAIYDLFQNEFKISVWAGKHSSHYYYINYSWELNNTTEYDITDFTFKIVYYTSDGARTGEYAYASSFYDLPSGEHAIVTDDTMIDINEYPNTLNGYYCIDDMSIEVGGKYVTDIEDAITFSKLELN